MKNKLIKKDLLVFILKKHFGIKYHNLVHNHLLHPSYQNSYIKNLIKHCEKEFDNSKIKR